MIRWLVRGKPTKTHAKLGDKTMCGISIQTVCGEVYTPGRKVTCGQCGRAITKLNINATTRGYC